MQKNDTGRQMANLVFVSEILKWQGDEDRHESGFSCCRRTVVQCTVLRRDFYRDPLAKTPWNDKISSWTDHVVQTRLL
jgi:hypothetical protein